MIIRPSPMTSIGGTRTVPSPPRTRASVASASALVGVALGRSSALVVVALRRSEEDLVPAGDDGPAGAAGLAAWGLRGSRRFRGRAALDGRRGRRRSGRRGGRWSGDRFGLGLG